jgi:thioredoxin 1
MEKNIMTTEQLTTETYTSLVLNEKEKVVLVDFWAEWCGPCRMLAPVIDKVSETFKESLNVYKLDTDKLSDIAMSNQITSIPCCILFKEGKEIHRVIGFKSQEAFETELKPFLS